jgi:hypothetical protein
LGFQLQVAHDYNFPLEFCLASAVQLGLPPPVDCDTKLSLLMSGDQVKRSYYIRATR